MDTPTLAQYYREADANKRKQLLELSIASGEEPEENAVRRELWDTRYQEQIKSGTPADGFMKLWMMLEFNRDAGNRFGGTKRAGKEIRKILADLKWDEFQNKGGLYEELLYRECVHLVRIYMDLSEEDKSYGTVLLGIVPMKKESVKEKLKADIYRTSVSLPEKLGLKDELSILSRAAREAYSAHFNGEVMPD